MLDHCLPSTSFINKTQQPCLCVFLQAHRALEPNPHVHPCLVLLVGLLLCCVPVSTRIKLRSSPTRHPLHCDAFPLSDGTPRWLRC
jgi:hypothetical protein